MSNKRHDWRDGNINVADADRLAWEICPYLRHLKPCGRCPAKRHSSRGEVVDGCRAMAEEVINICQTGNPWRKTPGEMASK